MSERQPLNQRPTPAQQQRQKGQSFARRFSRSVMVAGVAATGALAAVFGGVFGTTDQSAAETTITTVEPTTAVSTATTEDSATTTSQATTTSTTAKSTTTTTPRTTTTLTSSYSRDSHAQSGGS